MLHSGQAGSVGPSKLAVVSPSSEVWTVLLPYTSHGTLKHTHVNVHELCTVNIFPVNIIQHISCEYNKVAMQHNSDNWLTYIHNDSGSTLLSALIACHDQEPSQFKKTLFTYCLQC